MFCLLYFNIQRIIIQWIILQLFSLLTAFKPKTVVYNEFITSVCPLFFSIWKH